MDIQKFTWILERTLYYTLLFLSVAAVIFSFAQEKPMAGLFALILMIAIIHKGFVRITIPAKSVIINSDKVVLFMPKKTALNRFDLISREQKVVTLPDYGVFDRPYNLEIFFADDEGVVACQLSLKLAYGTELAAWQSAYDSFARYGSSFVKEVRNLLVEAASNLPFGRIQEQSGRNDQEYLKPVVTELNSGLASMGIEINEVSCSFDNGKMLVRVQRS